MTFSTYYDSNDTGLGGINNTAGQTVAFLDKVLVNGYNSTTLTTLTSVSVLCTATLVNHGYRDRQFVKISGATPSAYNGTWQIITGSTTTNTFQFNVSSSPGSSATGTLACIVAPLGWTLSFTGTNLRAYKQLGGNLRFLNIDDTGTTTAKFTGFETMSAISTGTNPFPTVAQLATGVTMSKSSTSAVARTILWGNSSVFYLFTDYLGTSTGGALTIFGDGSSFLSGDPWFTVIMGQSAAGTFEGSDGYWAGASSSQFTAMAAHYIARSYTTTVGSVTSNKVGDIRFAGNAGGNNNPNPNTLYSLGGNVSLAYPNPIDGNLWTTVITVNETVATTPRGTLVGIVSPIHSRPVDNYVIFTGTGNLAGKEYLAINVSGQIFAEVSNTF